MCNIKAALKNHACRFTTDYSNCDVMEKKDYGLILYVRAKIKIINNIIIIVFAK